MTNRFSHYDGDDWIALLVKNRLIDFDGEAVPNAYAAVGRSPYAEVSYRDVDDPKEDEFDWLKRDS
jgi:hypothetical protein